MSAFSKSLLLSDSKNPLLLLNKNEFKNESSNEAFSFLMFLLLEMEMLLLGIFAALMPGVLPTKDKIERNV